MKLRFSNIHACVQTDTKSRPMAPGTLVDLDERFSGGETLASLLGPLAEGFTERPAVEDVAMDDTFEVVSIELVAADPA